MVQTLSEERLQLTVGVEASEAKLTFGMTGLLIYSRYVQNAKVQRSDGGNAGGKAGGVICHMPSLSYVNRATRKDTSFVW